MTRKTLIAALFSVLASIAMAQHRYTVVGELPDSLDGALVKMLDYENGHVCQTTRAINGRYEFNGTVMRDSLRRIDVSHHGEEVDYANIILEEGHINIVFQSHLGQGTPQNDRMRSLTVEGIAISLREEWRQFVENSRTQEEKDYMTKVLKERLDESIEALPKMLDDVLADDTALGAWALIQKDNMASTPDEYLDAYESASDYARNYGPNARAKETHEQMRDVMPGCKFKDITFNTGSREGTSVSLSDYIGRGKYVLVHFWASWCVPCRPVNAAINAVYEQYAGDRFEALGITIDDLRQNTYRTMKNEGILWPQIYDGAFDALKQYGASKFPFVVLFAPDGTIVARNISVDNICKEVEEALAQ